MGFIIGNKDLNKIFPLFLKQVIIFILLILSKLIRKSFKTFISSILSKIIVGYFKLLLFKLPKKEIKSLVRFFSFISFSLIFNENLSKISDWDNASIKGEEILIE